MTTKIIQFNQDVDGEIVSRIYIGDDDISRDPEDVIQLIKSLYPVHLGDGRNVLQVNVDMSSDSMYLTRLLSKHGYTLFVPTKFLLTDNLKDWE